MTLNDLIKRYDINPMGMMLVWHEDGTKQTDYLDETLETHGEKEIDEKNCRLINGSYLFVKFIEEER